MKSRIWMALIAIYLAWGSTYLAIHYAVQSIPPFFMTGTRFLVAGIVLFGWRRFAGDPKPSPAQWRSAAIIGFLLLVGGIGGVSWAEQYVPSGISALIIAATPLWIMLIELIRRGGTRPSKVSLMGVLIGLIGMLILIDPWKSADAPQGYNSLGVVVLLLAALSWSIGSLYSHTANLPKSGLLGTGMELLAGSAGSYLIGLATGEMSQLNLSSITLSSLGGLAYLIIVGSLVGFVCYTWLLREAPTSLVVTYAYVNPLVAILLGSFIANEVLTPGVLLAAPLILSAVVLIQSKQDNKKVVQQKLVTMSETGGED
ncbi:MAG TPA: EamA family transporter [Anaerolineales bacterium]|nr:EamA family transporter [Anaerolineales bacterium]